MQAWLAVVRGLEELLKRYQRIFDAWKEGGVQGPSLTSCHTLLILNTSYYGHIMVNKGARNGIWT